MNRFKKEELKKYQQARQGLTEEQIKELDAREAVDRFVEARIKDLHHDRFPEEYDFILDSSVDANERSRGINPMNEDYIERVNARRLTLGVEPLTSAGYAATTKSRELCREEVLQEMNDLRTRLDEVLFYKWDPIHLSNSTVSRNEYTRYVEEVLHST